MDDSKNSTSKQEVGFTRARLRQRLRQRPVGCLGRGLLVGDQLREARIAALNRPLQPLALLGAAARLRPCLRTRT